MTDSFYSKLYELAEQFHWGQTGDTQYHSSGYIVLTMTCPHSQVVSTSFTTGYELDAAMAASAFLALQSECAKTHHDHVGVYTVTTTNSSYQQLKFQQPTSTYTYVQHLHTMPPGVYTTNEIMTDGTAFLKLSNACPGLNKRAKYPKGVGRNGKEDIVSTIIMYLNDGQHWPREKVAQWMKSTGIDFTFVATNEGD